MGDGRFGFLRRTPHIKTQKCGAGLFFGKVLFTLSNPSWASHLEN